MWHLCMLHLMGSHRSHCDLINCQLLSCFLFSPIGKDLISKAFVFVNSEELGTVDIPYVKEGCLEEKQWWSTLRLFLEPWRFEALLLARAWKTHNWCLKTLLGQSLKGTVGSKCGICSLSISCALCDGSSLTISLVEIQTWWFRAFFLLCGWFFCLFWAYFLRFFSLSLISEQRFVVHDCRHMHRRGKHKENSSTG